MDLSYRCALIKYRSDIEDLIDAEEIASDYMRYNEHFSLSEVENIMYDEDQKVRAKSFLRLLLRKSTTTVQIFLNALSHKGCYSDLLLKLKEEIDNPVRITDITKLLAPCGVPPRPPHYVERLEVETDILNAVKDLAVTPGWVLVLGGGGTGKSTLCAEALRTKDVLELFKGGIEWFHAGKLDTNEQLMSKIHSFVRQLDPNMVQLPTSPEQANVVMRRTLAERPDTLIVLDNLWNNELTEVFDFYGCVVVSTRDAKCLNRVHGIKKEIHVSENFSEDESVDLLCRWTNMRPRELHAQASELIKKTRLPLALTIIGAHLSEYPDHWDDCINRLLSIEHETSYPYSSVKEALLIGIEYLEESLQLRFKSLVVFPKGVVISPEVTAVFWEVEKRVAQKILKCLAQKSLLKEQYSDSLECNVYILHDLQKDVLEEVVTDKKSLHSQMVKMFEKTAENNWMGLPTRDAYFWKFIAFHLSEAGMDDEFISLFSNPQFLASMVIRIGPFELLASMTTYSSEAMREDTNWLAVLSTLETNVSSFSEIKCPEKKEQEKQVLEAVIQSALCCEHETYIFKQAHSLAQTNAERFWCLLNPKVGSVRPIWKVQVTNFCPSLSQDKQQHLTVGGRKGDVTLIDIKTGKRKATWIETMDGEYEVRCSFNQTGDIFAAATCRNTFCLYKVIDDGDTPQLGEEKKITTSSNVWSIVFETDTAHVLVGLEDGRVVRYPVASSEDPTEILELDGPVDSLSISNDGSLLGVGIYGKLYYMYSFRNEMRHLIMENESNPSPDRMISFAVFDSNEVVVLMWYKSIRIWNPITREKVNKSFLLASYATCFATETAIGVIAGGDEQGNVMVWQYASEQILNLIESGQAQWRMCFHSPNPAETQSTSTAQITLICGSVDGVVTRWRIDTQTDSAEIQCDSRKCRFAFAAGTDNQEQLIVVTQAASLDLEMEECGDFLNDEVIFVEAKDNVKEDTRQVSESFNQLAIEKVLPVVTKQEELVRVVKENQVVIVMGETGSGKTTKIPQILYNTGLWKDGKIGCTQPRRVAAMSVAKHVSEEMESPLGEVVGYSVPFEDCMKPQTKIEYMTDGILLRAFQKDPKLSGYSVIIIDEAHERTLAMDLLFGLMKDLVRYRPELKLIISSATLDGDRFSKYFRGAYTLNISGRRYPVQSFFTKNTQTDYIESALVSVLQIHNKEPPGDILVFFPSQEEIEMATERLLEMKTEWASRSLSCRMKELVTMPIYSTLPLDMQLKIFVPPPEGARKVVLATSIAESSLTITGIKYVIDTGLRKQMAYIYKTGMEILTVNPISQASANQRKGRVGRVEAGKCYRIYTQFAYDEEFEKQALPEILRRNFTSDLLLLKNIGIDDVLHFDYMDRPPIESLKMALMHLYALGATNAKGQLTKLGRQMAQLPCDPMMAKMIFASVKYECTDEIVTIAAMLCESSMIFNRPKDQILKADQARKKFFHPSGDHLTLLNVYNQWASCEFSRQWCFENFIQYQTMMHIRNVREQLARLVNHSCSSKDDPVPVCKAITAGYFYHAAKLQKGNTYKMIKHKESVSIHPNSSLFEVNSEADNKARYVLFHERIFTAREFMRQVIAVESEWLLEVAGHYFKREELASTRDIPGVCV